MSELHQQAMHFIFHQVQQRLVDHLNQAQRAALHLLVQRIGIAAGNRQALGAYRVFYPFCGGKDNTLGLAFLRAAQLTLAQRAPSSFVLRVGIHRHAGMNPVTLGNIERTCTTLFLHEDRRVQLLQSDAGGVRPFVIGASLPEQVQRLDRQDWLIGAHMAVASAVGEVPRLGQLELCERLVAHDGGVDLLATSEWPAWRRTELAWGRRSLRRLLRLGNVRLPGSSLSWMTHATRLALRGGTEERVIGRPRRFLPHLSLHSLFADPERGLSSLLVDYLGYDYSDLACGFGEGDGLHALIEAHLCGLREELFQQGCYLQGVERFLGMAEVALRRQAIAEPTVRRLLDACRPVANPNRLRRRAAQFLHQQYGISDAQVTCLLHAPIIEQGRRLEGYLQRCHPGMLVALPKLHAVLRGHDAPQAISQWLEDVSGLSRDHLQRLYCLEGRPLESSRPNVFRSPVAPHRDPFDAVHGLLPTVLEAVP